MSAEETESGWASPTKPIAVAVTVLAAAPRLALCHGGDEVQRRNHFPPGLRLGPIKGCALEAWAASRSVGAGPGSPFASTWGCRSRR